jgi:hypothetical protein
MMKQFKTSRLEILAALCAILVLAFSLHQVSESQKAFDVSSVRYSKDGMAYRQINLPFFADDGIFIINFTTDKKDLSLNFFVSDCIEYGSMNGETFYQGECSVCKHCHGIRGGGVFEPGRVNTLILKTMALSSQPFVIVENSETDFIWRALAILAAIALVVLAYEKAAGREIQRDIYQLYSKARSNKAITLVLVISLATQLFVSQWGQSRDVRDWMVRTEDMIHKSDWHFTKLAPDYSYSESWNMGKPPGAYLYLFIPLRLLFGFSHVYSGYLVKLPPIFGTLLVGFLIWSLLKGRVKDKRIPLIASAMYALNPAVIVVSAYLGKHDSLTIGLMLLALRNISNSRFIPYYGLSVLGKQFPALIAPWLILQKRHAKQTLLAALVFALLASPFLLDDPVLFLERLVLTHTEKAPKGLSWLNYLQPLGEANALTVSKALLAFYILALILIALATEADAYASSAIVFTLFVVFSKVVFEQYIIWAIPFLIITYFATGKKTVMAAFIVGSASCIVNSEDYHLLPDDLLNVWSIMLAVSFLLAAADIAGGSFSIKRAKRRLIAMVRSSMTR